MDLDPALVAVAGALSTVATLLYRSLIDRAQRAEKDAAYWRDKALNVLGLAEMASKDQQ